MIKRKFSWKTSELRTLKNQGEWERKEKQKGRVTETITVSTPRSAKSKRLQMTSSVSDHVRKGFGTSRIGHAVEWRFHMFSANFLSHTLCGRRSIWWSCSVTFRLIDIDRSVNHTPCAVLQFYTMFMSCCLACVTVFLTCLACLKVSLDPWHVLEWLVTIREDVCPRRSWNRTCWLEVSLYLEALHATVTKKDLKKSTSASPATPLDWSERRQSNRGAQVKCKIPVPVAVILA